MPLVFTEAALRRPTPITFPVGEHTEVVVPGLMRPGTRTIPFQGNFWTSGIFSPAQRVHLLQVRRGFVNLYNNPQVVDHFLSYVGPDATMFLFRRNHHLNPFRDVVVATGRGLQQRSDHEFAEVYNTAIVSWDWNMSLDIFNHFFAHGAPRTARVLSALLTDLEDRMMNLGYEVRLHALGRTILFIPMFIPDLEADYVSGQ